MKTDMSTIKVERAKAKSKWNGQDSS